MPPFQIAEVPHPGVVPAVKIVGGAAPGLQSTPRAGADSEHVFADALPKGVVHAIDAFVDEANRDDLDANESLSGLVFTIPAPFFVLLISRSSTFLCIGLCVTWSLTKHVAHPAQGYWANQPNLCAHWLLRGSHRSRSQSPARLIASAVKVIANPGNIEGHQMPAAI